MLGFSSSDDYRRAREVLRAAQYDPEGIARTLEGVDWITLSAMALPRYQRKVRGRDTQQTLIRVFLLGGTASPAELQQALRPMELETWIRAGLLCAPRPDGMMRCEVRLTPVEQLVLAADSPLLELSEVPRDFVMSPGGTSVMLGWSLIPRRARRTLDLGTGSGYLGLMAAPFSDRVIATDCNPRAVSMAQFNSQLNQIDGMESRCGDLWAPVTGERFDLVVSNPPFVITPKANLTFRDSGIRGDEFCRRLIREIPGYLEEGGYCQMLGNVAHRADADWRQELASWFHDLGCDALVFVTQRQPIDEYAMLWITTTESRDVAVVPREFDAWMDYYESERIEQVGYLLINLRCRRGSAHWTHVEQEPLSIRGACGDAIQERFALLDFLAQRPSPDALLDERLVLHPRARIVQLHQMTDTGPRVCENRLEMQGGLHSSAQLDTRVLRLLAECDGHEPLRVVLARLGQSLSLELPRVIPMAIPVVRQLMGRGFLQPVSLTAAPLAT